MAEEKSKDAKTSAAKATKSVYETLAALNVNEHVEKTFTGARYLSWAWAFDYIKKFDPKCNFKIKQFDSQGIETEHGVPYQKLPSGGYMIWTTFTVKGDTQEMWLPVMDSRNYAVLEQGHIEKVWNKRNNRYDDIAVPAFDAMLLNKSIMRCLVKNLAMFGLGAYLYAGEDLPAVTVDAETGEILESENAQPVPEKPNVQNMPEKAKVMPIAPVQMENIKKMVSEDNLPKMLEFCHVKKLEDMTAAQASSILAALVKRNEAKTVRAPVAQA